MAERLLLEMLIIVAASFVAVALFVRQRLSPIVGYLAVGVLIGPHGLNVLPATESVRLLGELGVAFLMFIVGLEFSLPRLIATRGVVFGMGGLQVVATTLTGAAMAWAFGVGWTASLVLGGAVAMSSTAVVVKQLADQGELNTQHGRLALGMLLFQDLASVPFLVLIDALRSGESAVRAGGLRAGAAVALFLILLLARRPFAWFMAWVARAHSAELFLLAALMLVLGATALAHGAGLSLPIGAFIAGMVVGEGVFRHQLEEEIRPFRDVLLGLFFITVGLGIDPHAVLEHPLLILAVVTALVAGKALIVFSLARALGWPAGPALRAGLVLAHGGEFALLLTTRALGAGLLPTEAAQVVLVSIALSMTLAPFAIQNSGPLVARLGAVAFRGPRQFENGDHATAERLLAEASQTLSGHVIVCGCGRVGRLVATALEASGVPYIALERDIERLRLAQDQGHRVMFGDATRRGVLEAAGLKRAGAVVSTLPVTAGVERLVHHVRQHAAPDLPVIASTDDEIGLGPLVEAGVTRVLPENLAAGLGLVAHTLAALGLEPSEVEARMEAIRAELNPNLRGLPPTADARWPASDVAREP
jgi:CPA2 family monovalent cation:H+ antiporter-2